MRIEKKKRERRSVFASEFLRKEKVYSGRDDAVTRRERSNAKVAKTALRGTLLVIWGVEVLI